MGERKLPARRRKFSKGKAIRVSDLVYDTLDASRRRGVNIDKIRSWDSTLRRMLGLPLRNGKQQTLIEGMLDVTSGVFMLKLDQTPWSDLEQMAYRLADIYAKKNRTTAQTPIRLMERR